MAQPSIAGHDGNSDNPLSRPRFAIPKLSEVLESFKRRLSPEEIEQFEIVTFADLQISIKKIQTEQASRNSLRNMARIRPFLDTLEQYAKVIEVFVNVKPDVLAFIWVCCSLEALARI